MHFKYQSGQTVAPKTWGTRTVPFSIVETSGWEEFMVTLNVLTESANGYLYVYYEYVTVANTLSFGESGSIEVIAGQAIGDLPAVPAKDGYEGFWTLDGQQITAETVWSYTVNKTAEAVYYEVVNLIVSFL